VNIKDKHILVIGLGIALVIVSNIIGHFAGPFSIFVTPILLTLIIAVLNFQLYKSNFLLTVVYNFGLLLFNDLFIRFYAGGTHDQVGKAWIMLFFTIAFVSAFITMTIYSFTTVTSQDRAFKMKNVLTNILALVILATLTGLLYFYGIADI
jgi:hypothetical protein